MRRRPHIKLIHESEYAAEVEVELCTSETGWSPYLSVADAEKLDHVREALRRKDFKSAAKFGRVYRLTPVLAR